MHRSHIAFVAALTLGAPVAPTAVRADWVHLRDGRYLRGIDLKKQGDFYTFVLETGETFRFPLGELHYYERSPRDERVEFRGRRVPLREKVRVLRRERAERVAKLVSLLEAWAEGGESAKAAQARFLQAPEADRWSALEEAVLTHPQSRVRRLAARTLGAARKKGAFPVLAWAALHDRYRSVRDSALLALKEAGAAEEVAGFFARALHSKAPLVRTRAANALSVLPHPEAVEPLLDTFHLALSGIERAGLQTITRRAYIGGYKLAAGGAGFSVRELADPTVRTTAVGVALDVQVSRAEVVARLRALTKITGRDFGTDVEAWRKWWAIHRDEFLKKDE